MNPTRIYTLTLLAACALAACSSLPEQNPNLDRARADYRGAQANSQTQSLAPTELRQAGDALARAEAAFARDDKAAQVDHLAYMASRRVAVANEVASRKSSEGAVAEAGAERDRLRLAARTREADMAAMAAANATRDAANANRDAANAQRMAEDSQRQSMMAQMQTGDAERRNRALEAQMRELQAKKTDRGMVITIGDVLFDTGRAELKPGGTRRMERLSGFLKEYPQRKAVVEGYTDSVGGADQNLALSARRAEAVMSALKQLGVNPTQLSSQSFGEARPVAGNENAAGRQMNRRVEIVLSDENGVITAP